VFNLKMRGIKISQIGLFDFVEDQIREILKGA
jgi:hypothetical protein